MPGGGICGVACSERAVSSRRLLAVDDDALLADVARSLQPLLLAVDDDALLLAVMDRSKLKKLTAKIVSSRRLTYESEVARKTRESIEHIRKRAGLGVREGQCWQCWGVR